MQSCGDHVWQAVYHSGWERGKSLKSLVFLFFDQTVTDLNRRFDDFRQFYLGKYLVRLVLKMNKNNNNISAEIYISISQSNV